MRLVLLLPLFVAAPALAADTVADPCVVAAELGPAIIGYQTSLLALMQAAKPVCGGESPPAGCGELRAAVTLSPVMTSGLNAERKRAKEACGKKD